MRFFAAATVISVSVPNVRLALSIGGYARLFHDMLGNKPLPFMTAFVIANQTSFVLFGILLPVAGVLLVFFGGMARSFYLFGLMMIVIAIAILVQWNALMTPISSIISGMQGTQ